MFFFFSNFCQASEVSNTNELVLTRKITVHMKASWLKSENLPNGGVFICDGDGRSCAVSINVSEDPGPRLPNNPQALFAADIEHMDIDVNNGEEDLHFGDDDIFTAAYSMSFSYDYGNYITCFLVRITYKENVFNMQVSIKKTFFIVLRLQDGIMLYPLSLINLIMK